MSQKYSPIICDGCGNDITYATNHVDYRIVVRSENKNVGGDGTVTAMLLYLPIEVPQHFCGIKCLKQWALGLKV